MEQSDTGTAVKANGFSHFDYLKITIFGFALAALWGSLHSVILQVRLLDFVVESQKNTYLGLLTFAGLVVAMAIQPIAGTISDRSGFKWGRRRPYILVGAVLGILFLLGIGSAGSYVLIFVTYCLLQASTNTAQASYQGFIPDLVPEGKRGTASGVKSFLEILGGVALLWVVARFMDRYFTDREGPWLWLALGVLALILLVTTLVTVLTVKERPGAGGARQPLLPALYQSFKIDVRANRDFVLFLVSRLLFFMAMTTLQTFALYFLMDVAGIENPAAVTADLLITAGVSMMIAVYPAGKLSDKVGRKPIVIAAGFVGAIGIAILFLFQSYTAVIIGGSVLGIAFGAYLSTNWALATDLVAKGEEARYLGLTNVATAGGAALARLIGPAIDYFNTCGPGVGYQVMLAACFTYFIAGSILLTRIKLR